MTDLLGETAKTNDITNLVGMLNEISASVRAKASDQFKALGLELKTFLIANLMPSTGIHSGTTWDGCAGHGNLYSSSGS